MKAMKDMKGIKGLSNKMLGGIKRKPTNVLSAQTAPNNSAPAASGSNSNHLHAGPVSDTPEAIAAYNVRLFCESGGGENAGDEITFLPAIVDAAESSPAAAAECGRLIRKYLHKDYTTKPSYQYNSIMLIRILADNPGMTFTRSLDKKFVDTAKELLRNGRDNSVRQILMETLDSFEATKSYDEGLHPLLEMWKKEKEKIFRVYGIPMGGPARGMPGPQPPNGYSQNYFARSHNNKQLPAPVELANRLEEARTSAKLLQQVVACTPPAEILDNELIKEFANRCLAASRSIQGYMVAENPSPDNDTMESLIDTNEQLQAALNQHQRAVLNARKQHPEQQPPPQGESVPSAVSVSPLESQDERFRQPDLSGVSPVPVPSSSAKALGKQTESSRSTPRPEEDPFRDPAEDGAGDGQRRGAGSSYRAGGASGKDHSPPRLAYEPFHPGGFAAGGQAAAAAAPSQKPPPPPPEAQSYTEGRVQQQQQQHKTDEAATARTRNRGMTQASSISDLYDDDDDSGDDRRRGGAGGTSGKTGAQAHRH